jgi:ketosteroid isomerase-like protein
MQKYFTADIVAGDATLKGKGLATLIWKKQADNSWKIVLEFENYDIKTY